jgi:hypothetical protein
MDARHETRTRQTSFDCASVLPFAGRISGCLPSPVAAQNPPCGTPETWEEKDEGRKETNDESAFPDLKPEIHPAKLLSPHARLHLQRPHAEDAVARCLLRPVFHLSTSQHLADDGFPVLIGEAVLNGGADMEKLNSIQTKIQMDAVFQLFSLIGFFIFYSTWIYRIYANAACVGPTIWKTAPVGGGQSLCPIVNLWKPYQVLTRRSGFLNWGLANQRPTGSSASGGWFSF